MPIPAESFEKLLAKLPDEFWRAYALCGWWAGLRLSEALHLRWEQSADKPWVDLDGNRVVLPAVFAKSGEDQSVPLHPVLRAALLALPRKYGVAVFRFIAKRTGTVMTRGGISSMIRHYAHLAGVKLSMHRLRKGFGCRVAKQLGKGDAPILHRLMRHSSMQITLDYYVNLDDALQDAMGGLV